MSERRTKLYRVIAGMFVSVLVISMLSVNAFAEGANMFTDIDTHWAKGQIQNIVDRGGITGYPDGTYRPDNNMSRIEALSVIIKSAGAGLLVSIDRSSDGYKEFMPDVAEGYWVRDLAYTADVTGLKVTWDNTVEEWDKPIIRSELAGLIIGAGEKIKNDSYEIKSGIEDAIGDYKSDIASLAQADEILKAYSCGIMIGMKPDTGDFVPAANATRAQVAVMVTRLIDPYSRENLTAITKPEVKGEVLSIAKIKEVYGLTVNDPDKALQNSTEYMEMVNQVLESISPTFMKALVGYYEKKGIPFAFTVSKPTQEALDLNAGGFTSYFTELDIQMFVPQGSFQGGMTVPIIAHEFGHAIHYAIEECDPSFQEKLIALNKGVKYHNSFSIDDSYIFANDYGVTGYYEDAACIFEELISNPQKMKEKLSDPRYAPLKNKAQLLDNLATLYIAPLGEIMDPAR